MRSAIVWCGLGLLGVALHAVAVGEISATLVPDLSLLATLAAAMILGPAEGLIVAFVLGLGSDMVSGALLGQHALVRMIEFIAVRGFASQLDLRRFIPQAVVGFTLSLVDAALVAGVSLLFVSSFSVAFSEIGALLSRATATGLAAPLVGGFARGVVEWLSETEARREMRIETRRPVL
jgi:rod shape-determining protein MreD